eukprot:7823505-Karenia_brevis.AAC.1
MGVQGIAGKDCDVSTLMPAPPPGADGRGSWRLITQPKGPIGHMLQAVHYIGGAIDFGACTLYTYHYAPIPFLNMPFQHLGPSILHVAAYARNDYAARARNSIESDFILDPKMFQDTLKFTHYNFDKILVDCEAHQGILRYVASLGAVTNHSISKYNKSINPTCPHCGDQDGDIIHILWKCQHPMLESARQCL